MGVDQDIIAEGVTYLMVKGMFELDDTEVVAALRDFKKKKDDMKALEESLEYWHEGPIG